MKDALFTTDSVAALALIPKVYAGALPWKTYKDKVSAPAGSSLFAGACDVKPEFPKLVRQVDVSFPASVRHQTATVPLVFTVSEKRRQPA